MDKSLRTSAERFRALYPDLEETDLSTAEENFRRYVALALRIYEAVCGDPERDAQFKLLTAERREATLRSKSHQPTDPNAK